MGERYGKMRGMEETGKYEGLTREDLIKIILDQGQVIAILKKELEDLRKASVPKNSTNSSIPPSKEQVPRTRSLGTEPRRGSTRRCACRALRGRSSRAGWSGRGRTPSSAGIWLARPAHDDHGSVAGASAVAATLT